MKLLIDTTVLINAAKNKCEFARGLIVKYSLSHGTLILDALIAATAVKRNYTLVTDNIKHFKFISELTVIKPNEAISRLSS